jgi:hypothetical protein
MFIKHGDSASAFRFGKATSCNFIKSKPNQQEVMGKEKLIQGDDYPYWFYPKKIGCGWGLPANWKGWVFLGVWFALFLLTLGGFIACVLTFQDTSDITYVFIGFGVWYVISTATLIAVPYAKGDPKGRNCNWEGQW